jgi:hypothetical protein
MSGGAPGSGEGVNHFFTIASLLDLDPEKPDQTLGKDNIVRIYQSGYEREMTRSLQTISGYYQGDESALKQMRLNLINSYKNENRLVERIDGVALSYPSDQMEQRILNAMRHAIQLCVKQAAEARNAVPVKPAGELF